MNCDLLTGVRFEWESNFFFGCANFEMACIISSIPIFFLNPTLILLDSVPHLFDVQLLQSSSQEHPMFTSTSPTFLTVTQIF